jgi:hypothetical protein
MPTFKFRSSVTIGTHGPSLVRLPFKLSRKEMHNHGHVIGKSKSGKSRFLANLYVQMLEAGFSTTLIDPAGDLAKLILAQLVASGYFHKNGYSKLIYLDLPNAERLGRFMPFNVLDQNRASDKVASSIKEACHRAWPELSQGAATFDTLLSDSVTLLANHDLPLILLHTLLTRDSVRSALLERETDNFLIASFKDVFDEFRKDDQVSYAGSVLRRARQLTQLPILKYGLGQLKNRLKYREVMDTNTSVLVSLGGLDPDATSLIGCLLTTMAEQAALSRADLPADQRLTTHFLIIDEFSQFSAQSEAVLSGILSLTRKYGLYLVMAHQTWSQASHRMRGALQNAGYEAIFKTGPEDAGYSAPYVTTFDPIQIKHEIEDPEVAKRTHPTFSSSADQYLLSAQAIRDQKNREFFFRAPDDSVRQLRTVDFPDPRVDKEQLAEIERYYLNEYFLPKLQLEDEINAYLGDKPLNHSGNNPAPAYQSFFEHNEPIDKT